MTFDYSAYRVGCFEFPAFVAVTSGAAIVYILIGLIKNIAKKERDYNQIFRLILGLYVFFVIFFVRVTGYLYNGGIYLIRERESDAVEICGELEEIKFLSVFSFPNIGSPYKSGRDGDPLYGVQLTVDGIKVTSIVSGDLQVGDRVDVIYLPKSRYVLYLDREETDGSNYED